MDEPFYSLEELIEQNNKGLLRSESRPLIKEYKKTQPNSSDFRDVHTFDRQVDTALTGKEVYSDEVKNILREQVQKILINPASKSMVDTIFREKRYDNINNISTDNLLADILLRKMSIDIFLLLEEQLADNSNLGQCPQGRSLRLIQVRNMLIR